MTSTLQRQLTALAAPASSILVPERKRASILFTPQEAAKYDRETFYSIGLEGINELISACPDLFLPFRSSILFSESSKSLERAVEDVALNETINKVTEEFLITLSPYLMLKSALKCLEWLVYRFHIERFNVDSLLQCIMPYYDTKHFVMIVQIIQIGGRDSVAVNWQWLTSCIQSATVLRKATLYGNVNGPFVIWLFETLRKFIEVHRYHPDNLSIYLAFLVSTIVGIITTFKQEFSTRKNNRKIRAKQAIIDTVLNQIHSLFKEIFQEDNYEALRNNRELHSAAYLIIATVGITAEESAELCDTLGSKIKRIFKLMIKNRNIALLDETYMLIDILVNHIFFEWNFKSAKQFNQAMDDLSFVSEKWDVSKVVTRMVVGNAENVSILSPSKLFRHISDISMPPKTRAEILSSVYLKYKENVATPKYAKSLLIKFEKEYPCEFDIACQSDPTFASDLARFKKGLDFFLLVNHADENIRSNAVRKLILRASKIKLNKKSSSDNACSMVSKKAIKLDNNPTANALLPRFDDDSPKVIAALLNNKVNNLLRVFSNQTLIQGCVNILKKRNGTKTVRLAFKTLCELANKQNLAYEQQKQIISMLIPYLFPIKKSGLDTAKQIIFSKFAAKNVILREYKKLFDQPNAEVTPEIFCSYSYQVLTRLQEGIPVDYINCENAVSLSIAFLLVESEVILTDLMNAISKVEVCGTTEFPVTSLGFGKCFLMAAKRNCLSIELLLSAILRIEVRDLTTQINIVRFIWTQSETINNVNTCMKFMKEFLKKNYPDPARQYWFWLTCTHLTSNPTETQSTEAELHLIRCIQFFTKFVSIHGIPASAGPDGSKTSLSQEIHKPLTRSHGKVDSLVIADTRTTEKQGTIIVRDGISPTWCLLKIILSKCLQHPSHHVRKLSLHFMSIVQDVPNLSADWHDLLERLLVYDNEIIADNSQAAIHIGRVITAGSLASVQSQIIKTLINKDTSREVFLGLVNICQHTLSLTYGDLEPMINRLLETDLESKQLIALLNCFEVTPQSIEVLPKLLQTKGCAKAVLKKITANFFSQASYDLRKRLLSTMIGASVDCKHAEIKLIIQRCVRKWIVDPSLIAEEIKNCLSAERTSKNSKSMEDDSRNISDWKARAEVVLEFVQGMKTLEDKQNLLAPLFRVLKICVSLEEQSPVEYLKQLTLTALTICCSENEDGDPKLDGGTFHVELVIDCLRCSRNPQTHHHALILLNYAAKRFQEQVLHGVMSLFTFMGNSILRQDDTYSTQLIQQTVTTIIPALTNAGKGSHPQFSRIVVSAGIFRVFASALQDIPVHRRLPIFTSLVETLNPEECLWQVLIIIVDNALNRDRKRSNLNADLELAVDLAWSYEPKIVLHSLTKVYDFFTSLATVFKNSITDEQLRSLKNSQSPAEKAVFDFSRKDCFKDIQLVIHYTIELIIKITSKLPEFEHKELDYDIVLERALSLSRMVSGLAEDKIFRMIAQRNFEVLEKVNAVLNPEDFVKVVAIILERNDFSIKRKILDMFNLRLAQKVEWFGDLNVLLRLLCPLLDVAKMNPQSEEVITLVQTALLSLKLIAKHLAFSNPEEFIPVYQFTLEHVNHENHLLRSSALLCIGELFCLKSLLLPSLNDITSAILKAMKASLKMYKTWGRYQLNSEELSQNSNTNNRDQIQDQCSISLENGASITTAHLLCISTITCMNKMVEQLGPLMGSKFLKKALILVLSIDSVVSLGDGTTQRKKTFDQRLRILLKSISTKIPIRNSLLPLKGAFHSLIETPTAMKSIMLILKDALSVTSKPDFLLILPSLCDSFLDEFLACRDNITKFLESNSSDEDDGKLLELEDIDAVEDAIVDCLISGAILKMSEGAFRPYYHKLFDWARGNDIRLITFYRLSAAAAERLKSLFVTFAGYIMNDAVQSLDRNVDLTKGIVSLFYHVFSNDRDGFVTSDRFNAVVKPLVDLIESSYVLEGQIELKNISSTLVQLAVASNDLNRWQQMIDLISSKAHHANKHVRLNVISTLETAASELEKDFLPLLPPVVPFLAELMNDDEPVVESATQKMLLKLESIVGEPLQPYFT